MSESAEVPFAESQQGKPYRWGGLGEGETYDCSGLIARVLEVAEDGDD